MIRTQKLFSAAGLASISLVLCSHAAAQFAANVASYSAGTTPAPGGFTSPVAALGSPERMSGEGVFPSVVSPFSPPYLNTEIVSVGEGGHITLRLSHYAVPDPAGPEIGIFANAGLVDVDPLFQGQASSPATLFGPPDSALVEVSENGASWVSLGTVVLDIPANGYTDVIDPYSSLPGSAPSDFQLPFTGSLASFSGLKYFDAGGPDILELLAGSGGGKWIDISGTGLSQVGFIRLSLPGDGNPGTSLNFELDGIAVSRSALGAAVVPEPATISAALLAMVAWTTLSRQPARRRQLAISHPRRARSKAQRPESARRD